MGVYANTVSITQYTIAGDLPKRRSVPVVFRKDVRPRVPIH